MASKKIILNAFAENCVGHINHGLWAHPRDQSRDYNTIDYWVQLARTLERGLFDGLFIADILGVYDLYQGNVDVTLREAVQLPINDPMLLVSAMAAQTQHLGFGVTVNALSEHPYLLARRFSTLDHLTRGRFGWNIVTGYLDSAARAIGLDNQLLHDERYDRAEEALQVLYKLLETSWDDDAVRYDKANRVFADPHKVRPIAHHGRYYNVAGYHLSEPSPQRTPVLYQAGTSGRGQQFAAQHAEAVFIGGTDKAVIRKTVDGLRAQVAATGRRPDDVKVILGISVVPGETTAQAREKHAEYVRYASAEAGLAHFSSSIGVDLSRYALDEPIVLEGTNSIQSSLRVIEQLGGTRRKLLAHFELGGRYPAIVGDGDEVAQALQSWVDDTGIDGFNLTRTVVPECFDDFVELVIPALQNRGLYKTAYTEGSLRHKLFGEGDRLPARHGVGPFRQSAAVAPVPA